MAILNFMSFFCFLILLNHPILATPLDGDENGLTAALAPPPTAAKTTTFKPGILPIVGIFTTIFSITFLLLLYMKHCKRSNNSNSNSNSHHYPYPYPYHPSSRRNSGIDRKVIASLPMFRFSSLRGQKEGLECVVCLNRFSANEVLRLLPKCKHAFHVECIDTWLEAHSTCPLCRYRVDPEDVLLIFYPHSNQITPRCSDHGKPGEKCANPPPRVSGRHSSAGERGSALEIIAENPGRASMDSWIPNRKTGDRNHESLELGNKSMEMWKSFKRKSGNGNESGKACRKDGELPVQQKRRVEHRIIISGGGERRWSDVEAAELLYLGSEMLLGEEGEGEGGRGVINDRSVSEITGMSRYRSNNGGKEERERQEERVVKRWLAWISQSQQHHQFPAVHSATLSSSSSSILL